MKLLHAAVLAASLAAAAGSREAKGPAPPPRIGYVYPAGGRAGSTFRVMLGGQYLHGLTGAALSGGGAEIRVLSQSPALAKLERPQINLIRHRIALRRSELSGVPPTGKAARPAEDVELPSHPLIAAIGEMDAGDLADCEALIFAKRGKLPPNPQIARLVVLEIRLEEGAQPGRREIRLLTRSGISNPLVFEIGTLPEISAPRVPGGNADIRSGRPLDLPVVVNGRVLPGETRQITFRGRKGEPFVARLAARSLIPYLSDAVPGWFQAVLTLHDAEGKEIAFGDDFLFQPDPVLQGTLPADGTYTLEVRDALFRGREDFVFRVALGNVPLISGIFPLGAREGSDAKGVVAGSGLPTRELRFNTAAEGPRIRTLTVPGTDGAQIRYVVDRWREVFAPPSGQILDVALPVAINGRLEKTAVQVVRFRASPGNPVAVDVVARRLGSALDASIDVRGPDGRILASADDANEKEGDLFLTAGVLTNQADPALCFTPPVSGAYSLTIRSTDGSRSPLHAYRVSIGPPEPGFDLAVSPSAVVVHPGVPAKVTVRVLRRGGFAGPVHLSIDPGSLVIQPAEIPAGSERIEAVVTGKSFTAAVPVPIHLRGDALHQALRLSAEAVPADDTMEAFLWRHLVPVQEFLAVPSLTTKRKTHP